MAIHQHARWLGGAGFMLALGTPLSAHAATHPATYYPTYAPDAARITSAVDNSKVVTVQGSQATHDLGKYDTGLLPANETIRDVTLLLKRSDAKQKQFEAYLAQLTNPGSPYFHHWLTASQVGTMFGPASSDIGKVTQWLKSQGLKVNSVSPSGMMIHFSGSATAIGGAFHTSLHSFTVNGKRHFANTTAQQIPSALAPVVLGAASLDNFFPTPQHRDVGLVTKSKKTGAWTTVSKSSAQFTVPGGNFNSSVSYNVAPADFDTIYHVHPLWSRSTPIRGSGQTVAVLERTDILPADVQTFRTSFLPADAQGTVSFINPALYSGDTSCPDPGTNGDEGEAALDAEWAGAAAPDANIVVASCDDSNSATFGAFTAAENLLNQDTPPAIFSLSYGDCEANGFVDGTANQAGDLWSTAAAEGVTVFVSSGDSGSAGCNQNQQAAYQGIAVNGMASTPYNVAVGGTDFNDFNNYNPYWTATNLPLDQSAISYIPEQTWNNSCASSSLYPLLGYSSPLDACNDLGGNGGRFLDTGAGSGGPSTNWTQPLWQAGIYGSSNYGTRLLPDVSLFAANGLYGHALVFCMSDPSAGGTPCDYTNPDNVYFNSAGGTSFAAPAMAGVQALVNQASGQSSGNILPAFYNIGIKEYGTNGSPNTANLQSCNSSNGASIGSQCVFNNITVGDIDVPCYAGTADCNSGQGVASYGVLSAGGSVSLAPAWGTNAGYSLATGLGSINAANLVDAVDRFDSQHKSGYVAPGDFLSLGDYGYGDGTTDIAIVDQSKGIFSTLAMKGSIVLSSASQSISTNYTIGAAGNFFTDSVLLGTGRNIADLAWTGPDNQLYIWLSDGLGGAANYSAHPVGSPYPTGWKLIGAGNFDGSAASGNTDELFWWNSSTGQIGWWKLHVVVFYILGRPSYHFGVTISALTDASTGYVPTVADVNGDGYADVVWTNPADTSVYVWINDQNGGFVKHRIADHAAGFALFGAGDINGDGKTDLIWTNPATHQMSWWNMDGFNVLSVNVRTVATGYAMASVGDFDGDGLADILWQGEAGNAYEWQSTGSGFQSFLVADASGKAATIEPGAQIQANRLQGMVTGGTDQSVGLTH